MNNPNPNLPLPGPALASIYANSQMLSALAPSASLSAAADAPAAFIIEDAAAAAAAFGREPGVLDLEGHEVSAAAQPADPAIFDVLLSNEVNRRLKVKFGVTFIVITTLFTLISYALIILASVYRWQLPAPALTALIVQAPLQMIGILYIMARHLFPTASLKTPGKLEPAL